MRRKGLLSLLLGAIILVSWFFLLRPGFLGGSTGYVMVRGTSMEPTLHGGDLVLVRQRSDYDPGDIVAFRADAGVVIHRIVRENASGYVMQGDNKALTDSWVPTNQSIIGEKWLRIPGGGNAVQVLQQPAVMSFVIGILVVASMLGYQAKRLRSRHASRKLPRAREMDPRYHDLLTRPGKGSRRLALVSSPEPDEPTSSSTGPPGPWMPAVLGLAGLLALGSAGATYLLFNMPIEKTRFEERARYEHHARLTYAARLAPSTLYPDGMLQPQSSPPSIAPGSPTATPPVIYTKPLLSLDVDMEYALASPEPVTVTGSVSALLALRAKDGWTKQVLSSEPVSFRGSNGQATWSLDIPAILALISRIEEEIEYRATFYELVLTPHVMVNGSVGQEQINDQYSPEYVFKLNRTQLTLESPGSQSQTRTIGESVTGPATLQLPGFAIPVQVARFLSLSVLLAALAASAALAGVLFLGIGRGERGRIEARYGSRIVSVVDMEPAGETGRIQLASFDDLVRMAERDSSPIMHLEESPGVHRYFLNADLVSYEFRLGETPRQPREPSRRADLHRIA